MAGKSTKGATWERKVARLITFWMSGQDTELFCYRSPGSGSVATINLGNKAISGDLFPLKPEAAAFFDVFSVECKNGYPGTNPLLVFGNMKTNDLRDFWFQTCRDAVKAEKLPFLIYNQPGKRPPLVGVSSSAIAMFFNTITYHNFIHIKICFDPESREYNSRMVGLPNLFLFEMKDFFACKTYEEFKKLV